MLVYRPLLAEPPTNFIETRLRAKFGGAPFGFPSERWPRCARCGELREFVTQWAHEPPMVDLGQDGRGLFLFSCLNLLCLDYGAAKSCEAFLLAREEIGATPTPRPEPSGADQSVWAEFLSLGWEEAQDGIAPEQASAFYDDAAYMALPDEATQPFGFDLAWRTKAGGFPYWTGHGVQLDARSTPIPPFEFLLQFSSLVLTREDASDGHAEPDAQDPRYPVMFANFGSDGVGFVFIDRTREPPSVAWFWTR
jgi:hypothetical protein